MQDLIIWLQSVEKMASAVYGEAASCLGEDRELGDFLEQLAEDENLHFDLLGRALKTCSDLEAFPESAISIDRDTRQRVKGPLLEAQALIRAGNCSRSELLATIAKAELSEWNRIFLYVLRICSRYFKEFQKTSAQIQAHEMRIKDFLASLPDGESHLARLQGLPAIWRRRILVVEDNDELREIFCQILNLEGEAVPAANGSAALYLASTRHFDAVISDIKMPVMNGLEFFRQALLVDPDLQGRLIFITGGTNNEAANFAREYKIPILRKPFDLGELREAVQLAANQPPPTGRPDKIDNTGDRQLSSEKSRDSD